METTAQSFGVLLRRYRSRAGVSQEALAEQARLSVETISALERGTRRNPYRDTVAHLATALSLSAAERTALESAAARARKPAAMRPSLRPVSGASGNLPLQLTSFVGRESETEAIVTLLQAKRLVTLIGSGGVGKTRIALEVAARLAPERNDGAWFVELASLTDARLIPGTIARALQLGLPAEGDPQAVLLTLLGARKVLLVLDNYEHLIAAAAAYAEALVRGCPHLTLLATSRQPLGITGEAAYRIPPLHVPDAATTATLPLAVVASHEALKLFVDRARAADASFALTDRTVSIVADICRRLDGIPFAIELAAARVNILSPRDLRNRLDERLRILTGGKEALPRQQTLRALIDWSYDLLDERERELFRRAGIFAGSFTLDAARAICGAADADEMDVLDVLASLVDKSLILAAVTDDSTRYGMLESTRCQRLLFEQRPRRRVAARRIRRAAL
jgi:predicted ATPase/DNA-binding XRE family transcriptional regulator